MAYEMQYENNYVIQLHSVTKKKFNKKVLVFSSVAVILLGLLLIPQVREFLIPGNPAVTKQAADEMIRQIQNGEGVIDAFAQFCQEIIQNS